jgi:hypothetical protein
VIKNLIALLLIVLVFGCKNSELKIEPIDKELNGQLLTLKGLDARLFNSKEKLQYFEIAGYQQLTPAALKLKLINFIHQNYSPAEIAKPTLFTFFFYKKRAIGNYRDEVYTAASDTENGKLENFNSNLVAQVFFMKSADAQTQHVLIYGNENNRLSEVDTLSQIPKTNVPDVTSEPVEPLASVTNNNCLMVKNVMANLAFQKCYETDFIRISAASQTKLSLTFINGKSAMDIDFHPVGEDWVSKNVTFFGPTTATSKGKTFKIKASLKEFDFNKILDSLHLP